MSRRNDFVDRNIFKRAYARGNFIIASVSHQFMHGRWFYMRLITCAKIVHRKRAYELTRTYRDIYVILVFAGRPRWPLCKHTTAGFVRKDNLVVNHTLCTVRQMCDYTSNENEHRKTFLQNNILHTVSKKSVWTLFKIAQLF